MPAKNVAATASSASVRRVAFAARSPRRASAASPDVRAFGARDTGLCLSSAAALSASQNLGTSS